MRITLTIIALSVPALASAAEISLRAQAVSSGTIVRLGDVAEIVAGRDEAIDVDDLRQRQLMPAPAPGEVRHLQATEVLHLLAARGVDVRTLQFSGAESVAIGAAPGAAEFSARGGLRNQPVDADDVAAAVMQYLREMTGHDLWQVKAAGGEKGFEAMALDGSRLVASGGKAPWTGHQRFQIGDGTQRSATISAKVQRVEMVAYAVRPIERGALVGMSDVALRPYAGGVPPQAVTALSAVVGKEATHPIRTDAMLVASQLRSPLLVRRGERVSVQARAGGVVVRTYATAQQDGGEGDLIMIESFSSKERYAARVTGLRELEVFAGRAVASDVAAQPPTQLTTERR